MAAVSTAAASMVVWPCAARLAGLMQRGWLPRPAEQVSAECLAEASTITTSTIATSATSSRSGSSRPMPMRIIRTMIATTWCGCERIMAGAGGVYIFAAELCDPGRARWKREQGRKRRRQQGNRLQGAALIHVREGVGHEQRSQLEQPAAYAYDFGDLCSCACGCDNRGVRYDDPSRRYETDQQRCATGNDRAGSSTSPARPRSGGSG
jgi:hypothetical protein